MKNTYYFVRHAHSVYSPDERNRPLSEKGRASLSALDCLKEVPISAIYSSPYQRAVETVEPLATYFSLPIKLEENLRERKLANSPLSDQAFATSLQKLWQDPGFHLEGGESNQIALKRGLSFLQMLEEGHSDQHILLSSHGNLICILLQHFDGRIDFDFWKNLPMPALCRLDKEGQVRLIQTSGFPK